MGKRSDFVRVEKDFYRTIDTRAVDILQPFLVSIDGWNADGIDLVRFIEPCAGVGDLVEQLQAKGHLMTRAWDIQHLNGNSLNAKWPGRGAFYDALNLTENDMKDPFYETDVIITNPPWSRPILHKMIEHFANLKPTWLLFDADWAHTKQSSELMKKYCTHIVSVGRLIWIPGTTMSGKDNCAWYRFDMNKDSETIFYGR